MVQYFPCMVNHNDENARCCDRIDRPATKIQKAAQDGFLELKNQFKVAVQLVPIQRLK